jgi:hypothetical protein
MDAPTEPGLNEVFERIKAEGAHLRITELIPLNVDPLTAASVIRSAVPRVDALRPTLETALKDFDFANIDKLESYALALIFAHSRLTCTKLPPKQLEALATEAMKLRTKLVSDVEVFARWGIIKSVNSSALARTTGYRDVAADILSLAELLRSEWDAIGSRCSVSFIEFEKATFIADKLLNAAGQRDRTPTLVAEASLDRQRVYTLCFRAYNQVRKAVAYIRRNHGDEDDFTPPLGGKRRRGRKPKLTSAKATPAQRQGIEAISSNATATVAPTTIVANTVGLPGADPFLK